MRNWIDLMEGAATNALFHVTDVKKLDAILVNGIAPRSYWATDDVSSYYAEDFEDNGIEYVTFAIDLSRIPNPLPDLPGIEEPVVFSTMGKRESQVHEEWDESDKTWQASLNIIGSIACDSVIPVSRDDLI